MTQTQFKKLKKLLRFVWQNQFSDFYRQLFKKAGLNPITDILNPRDYSRVPFLRRETLFKTRPDERLFMPLKEVDYVRQTSGTSGEFVIMYHKHKYIGSKNDRSTFLVFPVSVKKVFYLRRAESVPPLYEGMRRMGKLGVFGNRADPEASARYAAAVGVDAFSAVPPEAVLFGRALSKYYDLRNIKFIQLYGRHTTVLQREQLFRMFPQALILSTYSMNELGPVGIQCLYLAKKDFNTYHTFPNNLIYEIFPKGFSTGELVLTTLDILPTPIIRYKTGDRVEFLENQRCPCQRKGILLKVFGRQALDTAQLTGEAMVRVKEIEKALAKTGFANSSFELRIREKLVQNFPKPALELMIFSKSLLTESKRKQLERKIKDSLELLPRYRLRGGGFTLNNFLRRGEVVSFSLLLKKDKVPAGKKKIIRDCRL